MDLGVREVLHQTIDSGFGYYKEVSRTQMKDEKKTFILKKT